MTVQDQLLKLISSPLPGLSYQRKKLFRPSRSQVTRTYNLLNHSVFDNKLCKPRIILRREYRSIGWCIGSYIRFNTGSFCTIYLANKFYCQQWFVMILAHEMCHQYQWDIDRLHRILRGLPGLLSHGPSFFQHRSRLAEFGIPLQKRVSPHRWFKYQDLRKI
jgi:hypothetical protein